MRYPDQRFLLHFVERAFVVALGAVKLTPAFSYDSHIDWKCLGRLALAQSRDAEQQHQAAAVAAVCVTKTHANSTVRSHGPGALGILIAPNEFRCYCAGQARVEITPPVRQAERGLRRFTNVVIGICSLLSMDLAGHYQR